MRGAMFLAHEAWRQAYGQLATQPFEDEQSRLAYTLPNGHSVVLHGWREGTRDGKAVYEGPDGQEYDAVTFLEEATRQARSNGNRAAVGSAATVLRHLCTELQDGCAEDDAAETEVLDAQAPGPTAGARQVRGIALSQLDDWLHRGNDPIVRHMNLYV